MPWCALKKRVSNQGWVLSGCDYFITQLCSLDAQAESSVLHCSLPGWGASPPLFSYCNRLSTIVCGDLMLHAAVTGVSFSTRPAWRTQNKGPTKSATKMKRWLWVASLTQVRGGLPIQLEPSRLRPHAACAVAVLDGSPLVAQQTCHWPTQPAATKWRHRVHYACLLLVFGMQRAYRLVIT